MSVNQYEVLFYFQAYTGIANVDEAILHLKATDWDLQMAINRVMPNDTQTLPSELDSDIEMIEEIKQDPSNSDVILMPSTSRGRQATILRFLVQYGDRIIELEIPDTGTVGDLRTLLFAQVGVAPNQQKLQGWRQCPKSDNTTLASLNLTKENILFLSIPDFQDGLSEEVKEEEELTHEQIEKEEKQLEEIKKLEKAVIKELIRLKAESQLPEEPAEYTGDGIAKIRFRLPKGECIVRRFEAEAPLQQLFNFLVVKGYPPDEYKMISSRPGRDEVEVVTMMIHRRTLLRGVCQ